MHNFLSHALVAEAYTFEIHISAGGLPAHLVRKPSQPYGLGEGEGYNHPTFCVDYHQSTAPQSSSFYDYFCI